MNSSTFWGESTILQNDISLIHTGQKKTKRVFKMFLFPNFEIRWKHFQMYVIVMSHDSLPPITLDWNNRCTDVLVLYLKSITKYLK